MIEKMHENKSGFQSGLIDKVDMVHSNIPQKNTVLKIFTLKNMQIFLVILLKILGFFNKNWSKVSES